MKASRMDEQSLVLEFESASEYQIISAGISTGLEIIMDAIDVSNSADETKTLMLVKLASLVNSAQMNNLNELSFELNQLTIEFFAYTLAHFLKVMTDPLVPASKLFRARPDFMVLEDGYKYLVGLSKEPLTALHTSVYTA